jgi:hypothetical protein
LLGTDSTVCCHCHCSGIYEPESFKRESKYGLTVLTTLDEGLLKYLNQIMSQMEHWLLDGFVQRLVVVVSGLDSGETLERWQFNVSVDDEQPTSSVAGASSGDENNSANASTKSQKEETTKATTKKSIREIHNEIQAIIRQITASVSASTVYNINYDCISWLCHDALELFILSLTLIFIYALFSFLHCR